MKILNELKFITFPILYRLQCMINSSDYYSMSYCLCIAFNIANLCSTRQITLCFSEYGFMQLVNKFLIILFCIELFSLCERLFFYHQIV